MLYVSIIFMNVNILLCMGAIFYPLLSDIYVDLSDLYVDFSDLHVDFLLINLLQNKS